MKKVLAELHELINELEDNGLIAEASSLQEVFVRVAQEADVKDDLANDVENVLKSHSAAEVLAEIAKQMASESEPESDTQTMSFAYEGPEFTESERTLGTEKNPLYEGDYGPHRMHGGFRISPLRRQPLERQPEPAPYKEPKHVIMNEFIGQAIKGDMRPDDAYFMMIERLQSNGYKIIPSKPEFDTYVINKSEINPNLTVRQDIVPPRSGIVNRGQYQTYVKDKRDVDPNYDPIKEFDEQIKDMNKRYEGYWSTGSRF